MGEETLSQMKACQDPPAHMGYGGKQGRERFRTDSEIAGCFGYAIGFDAYFSSAIILLCGLNMQINLTFR